MSAIVYRITYRQKCNMKGISYTAARSNFAKTMQEVCDDHAPIAITRKGEGAVAMMSMEDYLALEETAYLLRSPKNMKRPLIPCSLHNCVIITNLTLAMLIFAIAGLVFIHR